MIAIVEEHESVRKLVSFKHEEFHELMQAISSTYKDDLNQFIFAWTSNINTINSIAMQIVSPIPNVMVLNTSTFEYYLLDEDPFPQSIIGLLDDLKENSPVRKVS